MFETGEQAAAGVQGQIRPAPGGELARDVVQVRAPRDPLVRDRVEPRQRLPAHVSRWPSRAPRPRIQSAAGMRDLPAGWTSSTTTALRPAVIRNTWSVVRISPGAPSPSAARAPNSFTSRDRKSVV